MSSSRPTNCHLAAERRWFSRRRAAQGDQTKYVTIIAQPDFNGVPQILFKQVTREKASWT